MYHHETFRPYSPILTAVSRLTERVQYCHVSGVCVTNKTGFGLDDWIY
jgi:hypothetical protein